jgi:hypothetical protein
MIKKRRLSDLYVVGEEMTFEDPGGDEPIVVWVQKLSPVQHEAVLRDSGAARAPILALKHLPLGHDDLAPYESELEESLRHISMVDILVAKKEGAIRAAKEDEVAAEDEWDKENYLQSLTDAWNESLMVEWAKDNSHVEAARVHDELERFNAAVDKKTKGAMRHVRRDYESMSDEETHLEALHQIIDFASDIRWMTEYRRQELYYAVRVSEEDNRTLYFEDVGEVGELSAQVFQQLLSTFQNLTLNPLEVKD